MSLAYQGEKENKRSLYLKKKKQVRKLRRKSLKHRNMKVKSRPYPSTSLAGTL